MKTDEKMSKESWKKTMKVWKGQNDREEKYFFYHIYRKLYRLLHNGFYLMDLKRDIVAFVQRGKRGWANRDVWGLENYLSEVIYKSVEHLKKHHHGYPGDLTEGQWVDVLNMISNTFYYVQKISQGELLIVEDKKERKQHQRIFDELNKKYNTNDRCMTDKEITEYEEGWELFKKYYFSLWD